jgi:hypothetical protein
MKISFLPVSLFSKIIIGSMSINDWLLKAKETGLAGIFMIAYYFFKNNFLCRKMKLTIELLVV